MYWDSLALKFLFQLFFDRSIDFKLFQLSFELLLVPSFVLGVRTCRITVKGLTSWEMLTFFNGHKYFWLRFEVSYESVWVGRVLGTTKKFLSPRDPSKSELENLKWRSTPFESNDVNSD